MRKYAAYINTLDALLETAAWGRHRIDTNVLHPHLNGGAAAELRSLVTRRQLRKSGAFFTDESLGRRMIGLISKPAAKNTAAWDPNCGAGDLLLRWSEQLSVVDGDLRATLADWGEKLYGVDIHPEFLRVAKRRLALAAVSRGARMKRGSLRSLDQFFPNLECRDLLKGGITVPESAVILMNPPFTMIETPKSCAAWASGKVAFAAVAFLECLKAAKPGQQILAILPDVLRSGTRYERWRTLVEKHASSARVHLVGRFNEHADVDVFILHAISASSSSADIKWVPLTPPSDTSVLGDLFEVRVGTIVPYRHEHKGQWVPYLTTANAPAWKESRPILPSIRHRGTCVKGPFLAVRRTSSPTDTSRAIATVIDSSMPMAVENHLITLRPRDGKLETCRHLSDHLKSAQVRIWLDRRIRCRHLTVSAIKQIPLPAKQ